jgi:hypothetical protein
MNVFFDTGKYLIETFQIAVVFLNVAFWNWVSDNSVKGV